MLRNVTHVFLSTLLIGSSPLFGNPTENNKENSPTTQKKRNSSELQEPPSTTPPPLPTSPFFKKIKIEEPFPLTPPRTKTEFVFSSPTSCQTPEGALKKHFLNVREDVARSKNLFENFNGAVPLQTINSPEDFKVVYQEKFPLNHFTHTGIFQGVPYYLDMRLIDPQQIVMVIKNGSLRLETNLERMEKGMAPFTYKVASIVERFLNDPIVVGNPNLPWGVDYHTLLIKKQSRKRLDIHHLVKTMGDGVTPLPSDFHHGTDIGIVVKDGQVLASNISRKDAKKAGLLEDGARYYGDCLHPNFGKSKIDRDVFAKWRPDFWQYVAELIKKEKEQGIFNLNPETVPITRLFAQKTL